MNNFYTLIYLIHEWKRSLVGTYFAEALSFRRNTVNLYFDSPEQDPATPGTPLVCTFSTDPQRTALFLDRYSVPKRANAAVVFPALSGKKLLDIHLEEADRYIRFIFENQTELVFLLYGNGANAFLCENAVIIEAFKRDAHFAGSLVPAPVPAVSRELTEGEALKRLFSIHPLLPRTATRKWMHMRKAAYPSDCSNEQVREVADMLDHQLRSRAFPHHTDEYGFSILPPDQLGHPQTEIAASVNEGVARSFYAHVRVHEFESRKKDVQRRLQRIREKQQTSLNELERLPEGLSKADFTEEAAHLLMAHPHLLAEGNVVWIDDFYNPGSRRKVVVDPKLSMVDNARKLYDKARAARLNYQNSMKRISVLERKMSALDDLLASLEPLEYKRELDKWLSRNETTLQSLGIGAQQEQQSAMPYRTFQVNAYEIRIGKSATANDELLRVSHKEDIWLHARGVSGSHVLIMMNKSLQMPPADVIERAAQYAAFFSKAKGSSLHPVIFTKRKYVRKPKGAAPGAVKVDREQVVLVTPAAPETNL